MNFWFRELASQKEVSFKRPSIAINWTNSNLRVGYACCLGASDSAV